MCSSNLLQAESIYQVWHLIMVMIERLPEPAIGLCDDLWMSKVCWTIGRVLCLSIVEAKTFICVCTSGCCCIAGRSSSSLIDRKYKGPESRL